MEASVAGQMVVESQQQQQQQKVEFLTENYGENSAMTRVSMGGSPASAFNRVSPSSFQTEVKSASEKRMNHSMVKQESQEVESILMHENNRMLVNDSASTTQLHHVSASGGAETQMAEIKVERAEAKKVETSASAYSSQSLMHAQEMSSSTTTAKSMQTSHQMSSSQKHESLASYSLNNNASTNHGMQQMHQAHTQEMHQAHT